MAQGVDTGTIVKFGLIGFGAWWLYQNYGSLLSASAAPVTTDVLGAALAVQQAAVPTSWPAPTDSAKTKLVADLTAAAVGNAVFDAQGGKGTADQWNYYRNTLRAPALTGEEFATVISGLTAGQLLTAQEFVDRLATAKLGVSGLGAVRLTVPITLTRGNHKVVLWATRTRGGMA